MVLRLHPCFSSSLEPQFFLVGPRAVFALNSRVQPTFPYKFADVVPGASDSKPHFMLQREFLSCVSAHAFVSITFFEIPRWRLCGAFFHFTCPIVAHEHLTAIVSLPPLGRFMKQQIVVISFFNSTHMTIGAYHHWDIAGRLRKDLSQRVTVKTQPRVDSLQDEEMSRTQQLQPLEEQRLLFEGRQLEDRFSPPLVIKVVRRLRLVAGRLQALATTGNSPLNAPPLPRRSPLLLCTRRSGWQRS